MQFYPRNDALGQVIVITTIVVTQIFAYFPSVKVFAFGLAFFIVGEVLFAASFVVAAQGSMSSGIPSLLGLFFMLSGLIVGSGRYAT